MNTYQLNISTNRASLSAPNNDQTYDSIDLFDNTEFTIDVKNVFSDVFPSYLGFQWGDGSPIEEPDIRVYRDYRNESIYPEIKKGAQPVYLNKFYTHTYYPSNYALKRTLTLRINIGYVSGETTKITVPLNIRTESYYETVGDLEVIGVDLLDDSKNSSVFTMLTKVDSYIVQMDNKSVTTMTIPDELPGTYLTGLNSIYTTSTIISGLADPSGVESKFLFLSSSNMPTISAEWNSNWWGYGQRDKLNFSGTSYYASGFESESNLTLVTPKHAVGNKHYSDPQVGDIAVFYEHTVNDVSHAPTSVHSTSSRAISAEIVGVDEPSGVDDLRVVKFDRDLTDTTATGGNIKVYQLALFEYEFPLVAGGKAKYKWTVPHETRIQTAVLSATYCAVIQGGNGPFGTGSTDRYAGLGTNDVFNAPSFGDNSPKMTFDTSKVALQHVSDQFAGDHFGLSSFDTGDSGSPSFIIYDNDILLAGTHISVASNEATDIGYGQKPVQDILQDSINSLGNSDNYLLSTVKLS